MNKIFCCPDKNLNKKQKIEFVIENIYDFCLNRNLFKLIKYFDKDFPELEKGNIIDIVDRLCEFSKEWDYRSKQNVLLDSGERARWLLDNDKNVEKYESEILEVAKELGFIGKTDLYNINNVSHILVLGGARESNILRPLYSTMIIEKNNLYDANLVLLSCDRPVEETENTEEFYYPNFIKTEVEAMSYGLAVSLGIDYDKLVNKNSLSNIYKTDILINSKKVNLYILNCPSSDKNRRANSADTYNYFFDNIYKDGNIVLVSSQLFVPYQSMKFMNFAIENDLMFDFVAYPYSIYDKTGNYKHAKAVKYLQEIRGTLLAINDFCRKYAII